MHGYLHNANWDSIHKASKIEWIIIVWETQVLWRMGEWMQHPSTTVTPTTTLSCTRNRCGVKGDWRINKFNSYKVGWTVGVAKRRERLGLKCVWKGIEGRLIDESTAATCTLVTRWTHVRTRHSRSEWFVCLFSFIELMNACACVSCFLLAYSNSIIFSVGCHGRCQYS